MSKRTAIVVTKKDPGKNDPVRVVYSSLERFIKYNPGYSRHSIDNAISRLRKPYEDESIILERCDYINT